VFERFTDRARRVVVLAQEEARLVNHNYIGTEHLLLGLLREEEGVAAKALSSMDISLDDVRRQIEEIIGRGETLPTGHIPFTPRAKKVLELSLRESIQLGHNYIGTEHLLLGLVREGEGVAAQVLVKQGASLDAVRGAVLKLLETMRETPPEVRAAAERVIESQGQATEEQPEVEPGRWPVCPRCRKPLEETAGYRVLDIAAAGGEGETRAVSFAYCRHCGTWLGTLS
jgi:ATP-dependent Clp protease ATP-binding subunit ClpC